MASCFLCAEKKKNSQFIQLIYDFIRFYWTWMHENGIKYKVHALRTACNLDLVDSVAIWLDFHKICSEFSFKTLF